MIIFAEAVMLVAVLSELIGIFVRLQLKAVPLAKISLLWVVITAAGLALTGSADFFSTPPLPSPTALAGQVVYLFGVLAGWYTAHRYLLDPSRPAEFIPSNRQLRFIGTQVIILLGLSVAAALLLSPLAFMSMPSMDTYLTQAQAQLAAQQAAKPYMPLATFITVLVFSRLLLVAPYIVRDHKQAVRRSWRSTKGHTVRLFLLQIGCLVPVVLATVIARLVDFLYPVAVIISTVGLFICLLAYTQLAETEYERLKS
jgi:hypothetical protein